MTRPERARATNRGDWNLAPCGLIEINEHGLITSANARFVSRTGFTHADLCRGVHWPEILTVASRIFYETQLAPMLALNGALEEVMLDLACPDGRRLPVLLNAERTPGADAAPSGTVRMALMSVPDRHEYEHQLRDAHEESELANQANLLVRRRLELLTRANSALASSLDLDAALTNLARVLVAEIADWCVVYAVDPDVPTTLPHWSAAHRDPDRQADVDRMAVLLPEHASGESILRQVVAGAGAILLPMVTPEHQQASTDSEEVLGLYALLQPRSAIVVPSRARAERAAVIILVRGEGRAAFTDDDLADITDLADRTGIAIDNLRLYGQAHNSSVALQKALLTPPPELRQLQIATRYVPGANGSEVGGDWYDAFHQSSGTTVLVIGDVVGHDIEAAALMGQLRGVIRTIAHTTAATAEQVLAMADRAAAGLQVGVVASAVVARVLEPRSGDDPAGFRFEWSNAGHPAPLLIPCVGAVQVLARPADPLLGVVPDRERHGYEIDVRPGDTLLLYTDGLIERRDEDIDASIAALAEQLAGASGRTLDEVCELALQHRPPGSDDVALLAVRVDPAIAVEP